MAEGKKGFLLYADLIHTVTKMAKTEEGKKQAGELFLTILEYVNDMNPVPHDPVVDIVFEPIKQQLKRDLKSWEEGAEERKERASFAGKKSGEARRTKTNQTNPVVQIEPGSSNRTQPNQTNPSQPNEPVTVIVNDTVNGSEINKKGFALSFPHGSEEFLKLWNDWVEYRVAIKKPYQTFSSQQVELQVLGGYPEPVAIQMIRNALKNGWKNIRPLDIQPAQQQTQAKGPEKLGG